MIMYSVDVEYLFKGEHFLSNIAILAENEIDAFNEAQKTIDGAMIYSVKVKRAIISAVVSTTRIPEPGRILVELKSHYTYGTGPKAIAKQALITHLGITEIEAMNILIEDKSIYISVKQYLAIRQELLRNKDQYYSIKPY